MRRIASLLLLTALAIGLVACQPLDRRPGTWVRGEFVSEPISDWGFSDAHDEIFVETRTWYGVPHSVTTVCAAAGEKLYVPSLYYGGGEFPDARRWNQNVVRDPRVRLKIGERIYPRRAVLVESEAERNAAYAAFMKKYPFWRKLFAKPEAERPQIFLFRMEPPSEERT